MDESYLLNLPCQVNVNCIKVKFTFLHKIWTFSFCTYNERQFVNFQWNSKFGKVSSNVRFAAGAFSSKLCVVTKEEESIISNKYHAISWWMSVFLNGALRSVTHNVDDYHVWFVWQGNHGILMIIRHLVIPDNLIENKWLISMRHW